ncbi:MAG: response regulator [Thermodesulfovibrionales bacterium]
MKTILVVDDDKVILELIARFLENLSIRLTILTAENGAEAIDVLRTRKVDLVLTDLNMPVMNGFELLTYISAKRPEIITIAMTGLQCADIHEKLRFLGVRHCIEKPFSLNDLNEKIIQILGDDMQTPEPAYSAQQNHALKSALKGVFLP